MFTHGGNDECRAVNGLRNHQRPGPEFQFKAKLEIDTQASVRCGNGNIQRVLERLQARFYCVGKPLANVIIWLHCLQFLLCHCSHECLLTQEALVIGK